MDDTLKKLGTVRAKDEGRDAIHLAVVTLQALERFVVPPIGNLWVDHLGKPAPTPASAVGIIDPFLPRGTLIEKGEWFFVYLKPGSISGLRHVWSHEAFPEGQKDALKEAKEKAERRVRDWCRETDTYGLDYQTCIELFEEGESGSFRLDGIAIYSSDEATGEIPSSILDDIELIIGKPLASRPEFFRCAC
jgi:hypothetical protein